MLTPEEKNEIREMMRLHTRETYEGRRGDTPTDDLNLVPRKYVTANGSIASRPVGSVATRGQFYLSTDVPTPMWFNGTAWLNGVGSIVASN